MKITGFIPNPEMAATVVSWSLPFVNPEDELEFLCFETWFGERTQNAAKEALANYREDITLIPINDTMAVKAVDDHLRKENRDILITCQFSLPDVDGIKQNSFALVNDAPCKTLAVLYGEKSPDQIKRVLFFTTGYVHDRSTLKLISEIGAKFQWKITVASVEEETGAKAGQSSEQSIKAMIHDLGLDVEDFEIKVVVDRMVLRGVRECFDGHDFVVAGMDAEGYFRHLEKALPKSTVAIVKRIPPLRIKSFIEWMPRINPADHADLIHELRQGSSWGPDFIVMLGLAAAVSTLGLLQDSPAVVIGSMLLAPLMTPMMGLGLALSQANKTLMHTSLKSILFGFLLTISISFVIAYVTPTGETLSQEVLSRGSPNVLDLMIALFAAGAAAYAMARPNIIGAIAGVAIATALVPPACSIGISLAHGAFINGFGASLLFFTNLVAIIAVSSFTFSFLGITSIQSPKRDRRFAMFGKVGLIFILVSLFAPMSYNLLSKIDEGKNVTVAYPVTKAVSRAVLERVNELDGVEVMYLARERSEPGVVIHLASKKDLPESFAEELKKIVRKEMNDSNLPIHVVAVKSIWISDDALEEENGAPGKTE